MKRVIAGFVIVSMLAAPAFADGNGRGGGHGWKGGHGAKGHGHSQSHRTPTRRYHENNDNRNDVPLYALGGLLLGGLITNAIRQSRGQTVTTTSTYTQPYPPSSSGGRRLLRDLDGRCYEVGTDAAGNELRSELPPYQCNW